MYLLYAVIAGLSDLLAGWWTLKQSKAGLPLEPRYIIAFAAGVLLAVTSFDILPEINPQRDSLFLALGFVSFYVLEKLMMIHSCGESECETHQIGPLAVFGMALDNIVDGMGIAVGYALNPVLGLVITIAVVFHEIPQGITSAILMRAAGWARARMFGMLSLAGALYPLGALLAGLIPEQFVQVALAFIAGDFIYIGASDLLPEAHRRFNFKVIFSVLLGMVFMLALKLLVPIG